jgi:hypothetical protein
MRNPASPKAAPATPPPAPGRIIHTKPARPRVMQQTQVLCGSRYF